MSSINKHPQLRFSGYQLAKDGKARLFLPGHADKTVEAEVIEPGQSAPRPIALQQQGNYWLSTDTVSLGSDYRFRVNDREDLTIQARPHEVAKPGESILTQTMTLKKKDGLWEVDNPMPTKAQTEFRVPVEGNPRLRVEKLEKGSAPQALPMKKEGTDWVFVDNTASTDTRYRFSPALDRREVAHHDTYGSFNRVSPYEGKTPQKSPVIIDTNLDSLVRGETLKKLEAQERGGPAPDYPHLPKLPMRNPFNRFALAPDGDHQAGLSPKAQGGILDDLHDLGGDAVLLKPFIGRDRRSGHGYWMEDPFGLNHSFTNKDALRSTIGDMGRRGKKLYADGAFVNEGLNGVQVTANRVHGYSSPFWRWLKYGDESVKGGPELYPGLAHRKITYGILPTRTNPETGLEELATGSFAIRVHNDPESLTTPYDPKRPTTIQLYDKRLEKPDGTPIPVAQRPRLLKSTDSVQPYEFEINPKELKGKSRDSGSLDLLEWSSFRLGKPAEDDSGTKWDGQVDTAMLNTKNPEVVNYFKDAVVYWSRFVMNTQVGNVTKALKQAKGQMGGATTADQLVNAITQTSRDEAKDPLRHPLKVLPPVVNQNPDYAEHSDQLDPAEIRRIYEHTAPDHSIDQNGKTFAKRLLKEVPMSVLPLPTLFKADLCYPGLSDALSDTKRGAFANFMSHTVLGNLARIPVLGRIFQSVRNVLFPRPFQKELAHTMNNIFSQLKPEVQENLRYGNMQSLLADRVGEVLYLSLLTGLQPDEVKAKLNNTNPKVLEDAFYKGMPASILTADPVTASKFIPGLLSERLKKLSPKQMGNLVESEMQDLDPRLAAVALAVLQKREAGLNWRIDAARDVGDMSKVLEAPKHERPKIAEKEFDYVLDYWGKLTSAIRNVFPKASIIPEITDLPLLTGNHQPTLNKIMKKMFAKNIFSGMPNMNYLYSSLPQTVHYAQRPDENGESQLTNQELMDKVQQMSETVPFPVLNQLQNMTSSHDFPTSSHIMLVNPALFTMDLLKSWGLKDDLLVAVDELKQKACFEENRQELKNNGIPNPDDTLDKLKALMADPTTQGLLKDQELKNFYDKQSKAGSESTSCPNPHRLKGKFVDELFAAIEPQRLGLQTRQQLDVLKSSIKPRIEEYSEAKAMRGAIVNAALSLNGPDMERVRAQLWKALDEAINSPQDGWGRHFGYQPLDVAVNHVFEKINRETLPQRYRQPEAFEQLKLDLYKAANKPVMDKMQRLFALQTAMPGTPSIYMHDLFAQGGSEWTKNIFLQNRGLIDVNKLYDADFKKFFDEAGQIFSARTRSEAQALTNGEVLPVTPDPESGIIPIVRDNGHQQVITLVNTGEKPGALSWEHKAGLGKDYEMPTRKYHNPTDYKLDLSELGMKTGTRYQDLNSREVFVLGSDGRLHAENDPGKGIAFDTNHKSWRMLVRQNAAE